MSNLQLLIWSFTWAALKRSWSRVELSISTDSCQWWAAWMALMACCNWERSCVPINLSRWWTRDASASTWGAETRSLSIVTRWSIHRKEMVWIWSSCCCRLATSSIWFCRLFSLWQLYKPMSILKNPEIIDLLIRKSVDCWSVKRVRFAGDQLWTLPSQQCPPWWSRLPQWHRGSLLSDAELWGIYVVLVLLVQVGMLGLKQLLSDVDVVAKVLDSLR